MDVRGIFFFHSCDSCDSCDSWFANLPTGYLDCRWAHAEELTTTNNTNDTNKNAREYRVLASVACCSAELSWTFGASLSFIRVIRVIRGLPTCPPVTWIVDRHLQRICQPRIARMTRIKMHVSIVLWVSVACCRAELSWMFVAFLSFIRMIRGLPTCSPGTWIGDWSLQGNLQPRRP